MLNNDPVTLWLDELRNSDEAAATKLWNHFVERIYGVARKKLSLESRRVYDEEDVAQSAFHSICAGIASGRFPELRDRNCLWRLILVITSRKVAYRHRYDRRECRDVYRKCSELVFCHSESVAISAEVENTPSREPTPEFAAQFVETCEHLFLGLNDRTLEEVVTLKMEGCTDAEIASRQKCSRRTVQRRLEIIRRHLERMELLRE